MHRRRDLREAARRAPAVPRDRTTRRSGSSRAATTRTSGSDVSSSIRSESFDDVSLRLAPNAETVIVLANPVQPHSEGEIGLESADPADHPDIRMNYFGDPHDIPAVMRRVLETLSALAIRSPPSAPCCSAVSGQPSMGTSKAPRRATAARRRKSTLFVDGLPPDDELPDRPCRGPGVAGDRGRSTARGRRERDAQRGERQHERGINNDQEKAAEMLAADHGVRLREVVAGLHTR